MALASAGCEMSSSSYTAGPRPELPGLWAAELASVASTQALQRAWQAGLRGRRQRKERLGTSQEQAGQVRKWLRLNEARARARAHGKPSRPSGQSTAVPKLNLRAFVVEADSPRPRVTCGRINVGSELHYRNKFLR
jgi:hypothetical protein